ncbi:MAG TPA: YtxH domain-containing protein [Bryobacteraceae bacterium]|nr:YtxH domain-containing protein [Bryobacteraceae bacterium]
MRRKTESTTTNVMWFVAGITAGAAVGLLYAPAAGEETRRVLSDKAAKGKELLATSGREYMDKGRELYEKGRRLADEAAEMFDEGRKLVES